MRVSDLKAVTVATADVDAAIAAFREIFGFPVTRSSGGSIALGIGRAEIEMRPAGSEAAGLAELVLEVDDVEAARAALAAKGIGVETATGADGRTIARLAPAATHGVPITLIGR